MTDDAEESVEPDGRDRPSPGRVANVTNRFIHAAELVAAAVFALLFAIGVVDLIIQIVGAVQSGRITDPLVVIGFIDTALLLFIIVEVYQTVIAYARSDETARILRLVIFTGVIALVRKAIVFRTGEYATPGDALLVAGSYGLLTLTLGVLLFVSYQYVGGRGDEPITY